MQKKSTEEKVKRDLLQDRESTDSQNKNMLTSFLQAKSKTDKDENATRSENEFKSLFSKELEKLKHTRKQIINGQIEKEDKQDRKSTRLNSSHVAISYAVFCLKKEK